MNLTNATALVTGGSSGSASRSRRRWSMQAREWRLPAATRKAGRGGEGHRRASDQGRRQQRRRRHADVSRVLRTFGHLDILVNNAAFGERRSLVDMDRARFDAILQTNVMGTMLMSREAAKHFVERKSGNIDQYRFDRRRARRGERHVLLRQQVCGARNDRMLARRAAAAQRPGDSSSIRAKCSRTSRPPPGSRRTTTIRRSCSPKTSRTS